MAINPQIMLNRVVDIANTNTKTIRLELNRKVHVVDISFNALKFSDSTLTKSEYSKILLRFSTLFPHKNSLSATVKLLQSLKGTNSNQVFFINDPKFGEFIIGPTYDKVQKRIAAVLIDSTDIKSELIGVGSDGKSLINIGHIPTEGITSAHSPLNEKLFRMFHAVTVGSPAFVDIATQINELHYLHNISCEYVFDRPNYDVDAFNKILGKVAIVVTIQSKELNNELSAYELKIGKEIQKIANSKAFAEELLNTPGSNTILEDITEGLIAALHGKTFKGYHSRKPVNKLTKDIPKPKFASVSRPAKVPPIRSVQGQFYSLASLQVLLNMHLQNVVSANMGDEGYKGGQRRILNYRTGRFASSVQVERLSQSREGMISAFYSYMKNPYQTFEPGFAQGSPKTRDPKLLIAKSIKEIAATKVANRMRAVLI